MPQRPQRADRATPLDEALARAGDGAFGIDAGGRITSWNRAAEQILGYAAREVIGRSCCEVLGGHDTEGNRVCYPGCQAMTLARMDEPVRHFDLRTRTKAGRPTWLNVSTLTIDGPAGERQTIHLFRDVTATKELLTLIHERLAPPPPAAATADGQTALSRRELEVLQCLIDGLDTAATAERLTVSRATVRNHVQNIFAKLGVHSRLQAVAFAAKHRLL